MYATIARCGAVTIGFSLMAGLAGCSRSDEEVGTKTVSGSANVVLRIIEKGYDDGWKSVGDVTVNSDGAYSWTMMTWADDETGATQTGRLPPEVMSKVLKASREREGSRWKKDEPVSTYIYYVDDTKTPQPAEIIDLMEFLSTQLKRND